MNPQQKRRKTFRLALQKLNKAVWIRDTCQCIVCGSGVIQGTPFISGAHHILSRGAHPELSLEISNLALLCTECHAGANTKEMVRKLRAILSERHGYTYKE